MNDCPWPDCQDPQVPGSEMCEAHRAYVDECMGRLVTALTVASVDRPRPDDLSYRPGDRQRR